MEYSVNTLFEVYLKVNYTTYILNSSIPYIVCNFAAILVTFYFRSEVIFDRFYILAMDIHKFRTTKDIIILHYRCIIYIQHIINTLHSSITHCNNYMQFFDNAII